MTKCIITGSGGLVGSESVRHFSKQFDEIIGIDNDTRGKLFGPEASVKKNIENLCNTIPNYKHHHSDLRMYFDEKTFTGTDLIIHCAAQPSHDWASTNPLEDYTLNVSATINLLELTRKLSPNATFIFMSTNKVYGDIPNSEKYQEIPTRYIKTDAPYYYNEKTPIDQTLHSIYGANKLASDILVQEYGKYYNMKTVCFRAGCISGPAHAGVEAHGFLSYLIKCAINDKPYTIIGYKGKQVRDNIHVQDLIQAFQCFYENPKCGEIYNIGGGPTSNCSIIEAIYATNEITGKTLNTTYKSDPRKGDHKYWITDLTKFKTHYPNWQITKDHKDILKEIHTCMSQ